jgi:hypothetical protein
MRDKESLTALKRLLGLAHSDDPKYRLHESIGDYLELIKEVLERAQNAKSPKQRDELHEIAQQMLANYDQINEAKRVVLGLPTHGKTRT